MPHGVMDGRVKPDHDEDRRQCIVGRTILQNHLPDNLL
jgi:hypothetical protein